MAMEMHLLFRGPLPSKAALARAIKELGFPLTLMSKGSLERHSGFMPMRLQREESGVEFDVFDGRDMVEDLAGNDTDPSLDRVASFRWGGDEHEMLCAMCVAAALAKLAGGLVFEGAEGQLMAADEAARYAGQHLETVLKSHAQRRGTRPADLKHYLKPLLEKRSDLLLLEKKRLLLIRPIRHVLRGAMFEPVRDKYAFILHWFVAPLHGGSRITGDMTERTPKFMWRVWEPHFQPLLMNVLAEDVFARVGSVTTLSELGASISSSASHLLGGESDKISNLLRTALQTPRAEWPPEWETGQRSVLMRNFAEVCQEFHDKEAAGARELGLGRAWEPSPFPVELPPTERHQVAETPFVPRPWIETPAGLLEEAPGDCGPVRFSNDVFERGDRFILAAPFSREEAEVRHRDKEPYFLTTRLVDGILAVLHDQSGHDKNNPDRLSDHSFYVRHLVLVLYGTSHRLRIDIGEERDAEGLLHLGSCSVHERGTGKEIWFARTDSECREVRARGADHLRVERELTDADHAILTMPIPEFGEFQGLVTRTLAWLRATGFEAFS